MFEIYIYTMFILSLYNFILCKEKKFKTFLR